MLALRPSSPAATVRALTAVRKFTHISVLRALAKPVSVSAGDLIAVFFVVPASVDLAGAGACGQCLLADTLAKIRITHRAPVIFTSGNRGAACVNVPSRLWPVLLDRMFTRLLRVPV